MLFYDVIALMMGIMLINADACESHKISISYALARLSDRRLIS
jgi:hypothetical protein